MVFPKSIRKSFLNSSTKSLFRSHMRKHALISFSSAKRIINCPPSVRLTEHMPDVISEYADEGTLAHDISELLILRHLRRVHEPEFIAKFTELQRSKHYTNDLYQDCIVFAAFVIRKYLQVKKIHRNAQIFLEIKVSIDPFLKEAYGHLDILIIADGYLCVIDLKYGQGVKVDADLNDQLRMYVLGVMISFAEIFDFFDCDMIIYQPRLDNITEWYQTREDILYWAQNIMRPAALLALEGKGEYKAGDHCQFCKARKQCRVNANYRLELVEEFNAKPAPLLSMDEIAKILPRISEIIKWLDAVKEYALSEALKGKPIPGHKMVRGKGFRFFTHLNKVEEILIGAGYKETDIIIRELKSLTALEEKLGKKDFNFYLNDWIQKAPGKPTLVPIDDKRKEFNRNAETIEIFSQLI